ncbi:Sodium channel protein type 11 subunit alpha [Bienertia sinuspersici]
MGVPLPFPTLFKIGALAGGGLFALSLAASSTIKAIQFATESKRHTTMPQLFGKGILLSINASKTLNDPSGDVWAFVA